VIEASLEISPEPRSLRFVQDAFGNHVGIARFSGRSKELCFESIVCLQHSPLNAADLDLEDAARTFPVDYSADEMPDLAHCIERHQPDPGNEVGRWARQFLPPGGSISTFELLTRLSRGINHGFRYRRRDAKGRLRAASSKRRRLRGLLWEFLSLPNCALEVLIHAWWHGFVVLISNVFAYHLRIQEAVTANAAMPLVAGEDVRTPLRAFRVVFGIGHFNASPTQLPRRRPVS
jgi:hypothetical protein